MPQELPRVDLEHPSDLDFIVDAVAKYAHAIAKQRVRTPSALGVSSPLEETLRHAIERPFDEALAARVRTLSDRVDEVTEQVVARRRTVPTEYAHAIARHSAALDSLAEAHEEQRRADILRARKRPRFEAIATGRPVGNTESRTRAAEILGKSFTQLRDLPTELCDHAAAADDQLRLVEKLRCTRH